jgi:hypothetical protein
VYDISESPTIANPLIIRDLMYFFMFILFVY